MAIIKIITKTNSAIEMCSIYIDFLNIPLDYQSLEMDNTY